MVFGEPMVCAVTDAAGRDHLTYMSEDVSGFIFRYAVGPLDLQE